MKTLLIRLGALCACAILAPVQATPITVTFEGRFTSVNRTVQCPTSVSNCSAYSSQETVSVPVSSTLSLTFDPMPQLVVGESHTVHPGNGRPLGFFNASQTFAWSETYSQELVQPVSIPQEVALPNPITPEYWNENLEWPGTRYSHLEHAHLFRSLSQFDDTGEVRSTRSVWSVGLSQNWYVTEGPPFDNIQYVAGSCCRARRGSM